MYIPSNNLLFCGYEVHVVTRKFRALTSVAVHTFLAYAILWINEANLVLYIACIMYEFNHAYSVPRPMEAVLAALLSSSLQLKPIKLSPSG